MRFFFSYAANCMNDSRKIENLFVHWDSNSKPSGAESSVVPSEPFYRHDCLILFDLTWLEVFNIKFSNNLLMITKYFVKK